MTKPRLQNTFLGMIIWIWDREMKRLRTDGLEPCRHDEGRHWAAESLHQAVWRTARLKTQAKTPRTWRDVNFDLIDCIPVASAVAAVEINLRLFWKIRHHAFWNATSRHRVERWPFRNCVQDFFWKTLLDCLCASLLEREQVCWVRIVLSMSKPLATGLMVVCKVHRKQGGGSLCWAPHKSHSFQFAVLAFFSPPKFVQSWSGPDFFFFEKKKTTFFPRPISYFHY